MCRRIGLAAAGLAGINIVDHGKIGRFGAVGYLDPNGRQRWIIGEADVMVGLPGQKGEMDRYVGHRDAGPRAGQQIAAGEKAGNRQGDNGGQDLETQHGTLAPARPVQRRAYGWQSVKKTSYCRVDAARSRRPDFARGDLPALLLTLLPALGAMASSDRSASRALRTISSAGSFGLLRCSMRASVRVSGGCSGRTMKSDMCMATATSGTIAMPRLEATALFSASIVPSG